ncbi:hypothetical protein RhoFasGS6_03936 [Rhodococcus fascians]|uniref:hypothetical protein n=1 Tax=Rhodococcoides fascians TaxID=1828 RepID=UPI001427E32D|nr:hypothetical protein [Rhodococcus fascians]
MSDNEREPVRGVGFDGTTIDLHSIPDGPPLVPGKDFTMGDRYPAMNVFRGVSFRSEPPMAMAISIAE